MICSSIGLTKVVDLSDRRSCPPGLRCLLVSLLLVVDRGLLEDENCFSEVDRGQARQGVDAQAAADPAQLLDHPGLAEVGELRGEQALAPLPLDLGPNNLDGVENRRGWWQEEQFAALGF